MLKMILMLLCVLGVAIPYSVGVPWLLQNDMNIAGLLSQPFSAAPGAFFGWDLIISAVSLIVFIIFKRELLGRLWFLPLLAACFVGVSLGLPLTLLLLLRGRPAVSEKP